MFISDKFSGDASAADRGPDSENHRLRCKPGPEERSRERFQFNEYIKLLWVSREKSTGQCQKMTFQPVSDPS